MKIQKTYRELIEFNVIAQNYLIANKDKDNKICACIRIFQKQLKVALEEYNEKRANLLLDFCSVDDRKNILKDDRGEKVFSVEGETKFNAGIKILLAEKVDLHSRISPDIEELIKTLTYEEKECFSEIVIPKQEGLDGGLSFSDSEE